MFTAFLLASVAFPALASMVVATVAFPGSAVCRFKAAVVFSASPVTPSVILPASVITASVGLSTSMDATVCSGRVVTVAVDRVEVPSLAQAATKDKILWKFKLQVLMITLTNIYPFIYWAVAISMLIQHLYEPRYCL